MPDITLIEAMVRIKGPTEGNEKLIERLETALEACFLDFEEKLKALYKGEELTFEYIVM